MITTKPFALTGKVALVTGAGRGLGLEVARALARAGALVVCNGRVQHRLETVVTDLTAEGYSAAASPFDVADHLAVEHAVASIVSEHGRLDILVNNVGVRDRRDLFEFALADLRRLLEIDLVAPFHLSREAARAMIPNSYGGIINITSIAGPIACSGDAAYTAAKGGLEALTRALAAELGVHGITANALAPGYFATEANAAMVADEEVVDWLRRRTSLGRWGKPEEFAGAAVFLASEAAAFITGQTITIDGGNMAHF